MHRLIQTLLLTTTLSLGFAETCCGRGFDEVHTQFSLEEERLFLAFVSLSIPEASLQDMSKHLEQVGGQFIFRGMPKGSFEGFLKLVMDFREKGILAPILIDPESFEEYGVTEVPTFVYVEGEKFKKVVGNVSVPYAFEKLSDDDSQDYFNKIIDWTEILE